LDASLRKVYGAGVILYYKQALMRRREKARKADEAVDQLAKKLLRR
jgi:hypothetical protein